MREQPKFPNNVSVLPAQPLRLAPIGPSPGLLCLKPKPARNLPGIDHGTSLISDQTLLPPQEIVSGILHRQTKALLASGSKIGKTWMLLNLVACIVAGIPFFRWATTACSVLYINFEIHRAFIKQRLQIIKEKYGLQNLDNLDVWTLRGHGVDLDALWEEILEGVSREEYGVIVLDPIYKLMVGRSENTASGVGVLCNNIERLAERSGAAVVYAHHYTKGNAAHKKAIDRPSGSGVFARDADSIITLTEHREDNCYVLETTLRNFPPQPAFVVEWDFPIFIERQDLDPADLKGGEAEQEEDELEPLLALLDEKPLGTGDWERAAADQGYSRATFFRMKQKLEQARRLLFDRKTKTWARADASGGTALDDSNATPAVTATAETTETTETPPGAAPRAGKDPESQES